MRNTVVLVLLLCFLVCSKTAIGSQGDKEKYRLMFSTFDVSSAGNYTYLRDGIQSMLVSRLATKDRIEIIDRQVGEKELARLKSGKSREGDASPPPVDFLVEGALYGLKSGLNVQVVLYPVAENKEILRFSIITNTPDTLISDIEQLAGEIVQAAIGKKALPPPPQQKDAADGEVKGFVTVHPEAAFKKSMYSGTVVGVQGSVVQTSALGSKRNMTLPTEMTGMAIYDVDGDGTGEIFILAGRRLELYKLNGKNIDKVAATLLPKNLKVHAINAADLDNDGRPELYISATADLEVASMIIKWDKNNGFAIVTQNIAWYLRPLYVPGKGWRLAGQRRGLEKTQFVREGVYLLNVDGRFEPKEGERLPLPKRVNLFDFVYADLDGDGKPETVAVDRREKLKVFNQTNELLWVSERNFGGSKVYLGPSYGEAVNEQDRRNLTVEEDTDRELIFVPGRMVVADVDRDGREEIIVNENILPSLGFVDSSIVGFFSRLKTYKEGTIVALAWNGEALNEFWRTGKFRGYIADHGFSPLEKTAGEGGQATVAENQKSIGRLFVGRIPNSGSLASLLPGSDDSDLTVYDLEFFVEKTN